MLATPEKALVLGFSVVTLIAPPMVLRPNSVPCGPRSTSRLATSTQQRNDPTGRGTEPPSMYKPTPGSTVGTKSDWPTPRMNTAAFELEPPAPGFSWYTRLGT